MISLDDGFGAALRSVRRQLGLTQLALAHQIRTTQRHVSFLETGRSAPSRRMLGRLCTELPLSDPQRRALFRASGFENPFPMQPDPDARAAGLALLEQRVLAHWPFPAFVLDHDWNLLGENAAGARLITAMGDERNMLRMLLSDAFRAFVANWKEASTALFHRLQDAAARSAFLRDTLDEALERGLFDHISPHDPAPPTAGILPIVLELPSGERLQITSLLGQLGALFDASLEGLEIELIVPLDAASEAPLRRLDAL
ncbi:MAG: helix-turn-helix domain-containing protein [Myxococcota bacterium]